MLRTPLPRPLPPLWRSPRPVRANQCRLSSSQTWETEAQAGPPVASGDLRVLVAGFCCRNRAYVITRKCSVVTAGPGSVPPTPPQPACLIGSQPLKTS